MSTPNFSSIMNKSWDDVEPPKPFPVGHYICVVKGLPRQDQSSKKKTDFYEFTLQPISAMDDVDEDALREFGGLTDKTLRATFYLTDEALYRLKDFVEACGVDPSGKTPAQTINELPNCQVIAQVKHRPGDNGRIFTDVSSFSKVGEDDED